MRKKYDKNIELSYLMCFDVNNLYGWTMSQKLPVNKFKWVKDLSRFNESFIKSYDENSHKGFFLEVDVEYPKKLFNFHKDLSLLPERKKYKNAKSLFVPCKTKKTMFFLKTNALKQALNGGLILKTLHRIIQFNQEAWLKPYIDMNTKLKKEAKNEFEKDFYELMNNPVFGKTMENVREHRDTELVTTDNKKKQISSRT